MVANCDHLLRLKFSPVLPRAFTEHGALMAANILSSPSAVAMSVYVIRAFVSMREDEAANAAILKRLAEIDKTLLLHDGALRDIYQKLRPLLEPAPPSPKPQIGLHVKEDTAPYRIDRRPLKSKFAVGSDKSPYTHRANDGYPFLNFDPPSPNRVYPFVNGILESGDQGEWFPTIPLPPFLCPFPPW